jgi:hypothetical protein
MGHKKTLALRSFLTYRATPSEFEKFMIHPPELSANYQQIHLIAKQEKTWREMAAEFCLRSIFHTPRVL